ncbi:MAG: hypothetical protein ACYSTL_04205, partial [Planctomycetota bacterium]
MLGKGRILCILLLIALVASPAFAIRYRIAPWAQKQTTHWFDCNAWEDYYWWDPTKNARFTWDPNWGGNYAQIRDGMTKSPPPSGYKLYLNPNPSDPNVGFNNYCDVIANIISCAKNHSGEWLEFEIDDANVYIGDPAARPDGGWNPLGVGKEGWAKITINDSRFECDAVHVSDYASPPNAVDPNDPNEDPTDPNTWTGPWPAHENQLFLTGTTTMQLFEAGFFFRIGGQYDLPTPPTGRKGLIQFGPDVTVITAPPDDGGTPADPTDDTPGTDLCIRDKGTLEWVIGPSGHCTVQNLGDARFLTGSMVSAFFQGVAPPVVLTNYTLMTVAGNITNSGPLALAPGMPANWSLNVGSGAVVLTYDPNPSARVENVEVFHNNSYYDGNNAAANVADDSAIDTSKNAGVPGVPASYANVVANRKGINGIMVDIMSLIALGGAPTAGDFTIAHSGVSNGGTYPGDYSASAGPTSV